MHTSKINDQTPVMLVVGVALGLHALHFSLLLPLLPFGAFGVFFQKLPRTSYKRRHRTNLL
jgi:hypothetical protein